MYTTYISVRSLNTHQLTKLLVEGDAPERVWACWALAQNGISNSVASDILTEPSPGVRLNLIVMAAGMGYRAILEALALNDPDTHVRASACLYIGRISTEQQSCDPFLSNILNSNEAVSVKKSIMRDLLRDHRTLPNAIVPALMADQDDDFRQLTSQCLLQNPMDYELVNNKQSMLITALYKEENLDIKDNLYALCALAFSHEKLLKIYPTDNQFILYLLNKIKSSSMVLIWNDVKGLVNTVNIDTQSTLLNMLEPQDCQEFILWALHHTYILYIENSQDYHLVQISCCRQLSCYSGPTTFSKDAEFLFNVIEKERSVLLKQDYDDDWCWDPKKEYERLGQFTSELIKWRE